MHLRMRARELRIEAHVERCVEIDGCVEVGLAWTAQQAARDSMACWGPTAQQAIQFCAAKGGAGGRGLECAVREVISAEVERGVDRKHRGHVVAKEETGELEAVITLLIQLLQVRPFFFRLMKTPECRSAVVTTLYRPYKGVNRDHN